MNKSKLYEQTVKLAEQGKPEHLMPGMPDNPANKGKSGYVEPILQGKPMPLDNETIHMIADVASFGLVFLGPIGMLASAGIQLANAGLYAAEGETKQAGLATVFALLPGLPSVANRIPGLKGMTQKGIDALLKAVQAKKVTPAQKIILNKIGVNKDFIKKEIESLIKTKAKTNAAKIASSTLSPAKKTALQKLGQGTIQLGALGTKMSAVNLGYMGAGSGYNKVYDWVLPPYEVALKQQKQESYKQFMAFMKQQQKGS